MKADAQMLAGQKPMIELRKVSKWFGDFQVLRDIDLTVHAGQKLLCLFLRLLLVRIF